MKYPEKQKLLAIFLSALVFLAACKKDSDSSSEPPVTEPLAQAAAKPGDTLVIKGQNFSTTLTDNVVSFNGVTATVVSATATELKVVIPANATSGAITITLHGNTVEVGSMVIAPLTFYLIKGNYENGAEYQVITINLDNGSESLVATLGATSGDRINDVVYLPATNEIMGMNDEGTKLVKVNVTTKQKATVNLPTTATTGFIQLVVGNNNLYAVKHDWTDNNHYMQSLVKIDPATGNATVIKSFELGEDWESLLYIAASNNVVGLTDEGTRLLKVNLTTKDTSSVRLPASNTIPYRTLVVDNQSNLFSYKLKMTGAPQDFVAQFVKLNAATGQETFLTTLPTDGKIHDKILFVPQRNEFVTTWEQKILFRINATSGTYASFPLSTGYSKTYDYLISN